MRTDTRLAVAGAALLFATTQAAAFGGLVGASPARADVPVSPGLDDAVFPPIPVEAAPVVDAADTLATPELPPVAAAALPQMRYPTDKFDSSTGLGVAPAVELPAGVPRPLSTAAVRRARGTVSTFTTTVGRWSGLGQVGSLSPSDVNVAAGPNDIVEVTNSGFAVYSRAGAELYKTSLDGWFGGTDNFDPHVFYEPLGHHFIAVVDHDGRDLQLSISDDDTAIGSWCGVIIKNVVPSGHFADFPLIGSNLHRIVMSIVDFSSEGSGGQVKDSRVYNFPRTTLESCQSASGYYYKNLRDPNTGNFFSSDHVATQIAPVISYSSDELPYLVDTYRNGGAHATMWWIDANNVLRAHRVVTQTYDKQSPAAQPGTTHRIDPGDNRITQAVGTDRGVFVAFTSKYDWGGGDVNSVLEWVQFDPAPGAEQLLNDGAFGRRGQWFMYPAVAMNHNHDLMFGWAESGASEYPSSGYVSQDVNGVQGVPYFLDQGAYSWSLVKGENCSDCYRWGDYGSALLDPANSNDFLVAQQTTTATDVWGTKFGLVGP